VHSVLEEHDVLELLRDDLLPIATKEIYSEGRTRREVQKDIKSKEKAIETLASRYARGRLTQEEVRQCLYSIGDNHAFLRTNRDPCERMIAYLQKYFHPTDPGKDESTSLAIRSGRGGARLSHDHAKQYAYVIQSLTLWREILHGQSIRCYVQCVLILRTLQTFSIFGH
jgi:anti-sigma-K factor RskA